MPINFPSPATEGQAHPDTADLLWSFIGSRWSSSAAFIAGMVGATSFTGMILPWHALSSPNSDWLVCDGAAVDRVTYDGLFAAIGEMYGPGDGSTTFNLPNLGEKVIAGSSATNLTGSEAGSPTVSLTVTQMPSHTHVVTMDAVTGHQHGATPSVSSSVGTATGGTSNGGAHSHDMFSTTSFAAGASYDVGAATNIHYESTITTDGDGSHSHGLAGVSFSSTADSAATTSSSDGGYTPAGTSTAAGGGAGANIIQPYLATAFMIRA